MARNREAERALALFDEAQTARTHGDLGAAAAKLRESVSLYPNEASLAALADCLLRWGHDGEAIVYLSASLGLGESTATRVSLSQAFARIGSRADALHHLRLVLERERQHPEARKELKRLLRDPMSIEETAIRHRVVQELGKAVPELPLGRDASPLHALQWVAGYVLLRSELADAAQRPDIVRLFELFNQLAIHPDPEVADLLTGAVFPDLAEWSGTAELARSHLVGRGKRAFDEAVALWGPPRDGLPGLTVALLPVFVAMTVPGFQAGGLKVGPALARQILDAVNNAGSSAAPELRGRLEVLSRMGDSKDVAVLKSFFAGLREIMESRAPAAIELARQTFTGQARAALERELGFNP
jgi:hypothetical protein